MKSMTDYFADWFEAEQATRSRHGVFNATDMQSAFQAGWAARFEYTPTLPGDKPEQKSPKGKDYFPEYVDVRESLETSQNEVIRLNKIIDGLIN